ncbi:MAG: CdaR family protein [Acidobacteriota bacterium]
MHWMNDYLKALKEYARDYVLENPGLKVLALLITAVLWLSVASRPVSQISLNSVPIEIYNPESPNLIVSKYDTLTARVYLEGPREVLETLRAGQFSVTADLSDIEAGVRVIPLKIEPNRLPSNVIVKEIEPRTIRVTVERVIEKEVPIIPRWEGEPPAGYEVLDWQITPYTVKISGAESQMREITEVSTETVRLTDKIGTFSATVAIDIGSPNLTIREDSGRKVMLTVNVGEVRKERVINNVPVALFGASGRARPMPRFVKVTLYGARSALDEMTASDVSVAVEYRGGSGAFTPRVTLSPGFTDRVVVRSVEPQTVRVR